MSGESKGKVDEGRTGGGERKRENKLDNPWKERKKTSKKMKVLARKKKK